MQESVLGVHILQGNHSFYKSIELTVIILLPKQERKIHGKSRKGEF